MSSTWDAHCTTWSFFRHCESSETTDYISLKQLAQVLHVTQHPMDLLEDLLRKSWENQVKKQPGVDHVMPVEDGLHQCEPGEGILGPEWWQFHLGRRYVLVCRRQIPRGRRREAWWPRGPLRVPSRVVAGPVLTTRPSEVIIPRGGVPPHRSMFLAACSFACHQCESSETTDYISLKQLAHFYMKISLRIFITIIRRLILYVVPAD